jgi:membrane protease YdiL (CAAX protease family)
VSFTDEPVAESGRPAGGYLPGTPWTYADPMWVFLGGLAASFMAAIPLALRYGDSGVPDSAIIGILAPAQFGGMAFVIFVLWRSRDPRPLGEALGLRIRMADSWALVVGVALQIGAGVLLLALRELLPISDPPDQGITESLEVIEGAGVKLVALFVVVALAPTVEEIMFRGMLLSRLLRSFGRHTAVVISAAAFAVSHVIGDPNSWFASIALLPVGMGLGYLALSGRSLSRAIWAHAGVNLLAAIGLLFLEDLQRIQNELEQSVESVLRLLF